MSTKAIQNILIGLVFTTLIIPFLVFNSTYFPFIVGKAFIFRIILVLMLIFWAWLCFRDSKFLPTKNGILFSFLALVIFYFISAIFGPDFRESIFSNFERMMGWITTFMLFVFFVITSSVMKEKKHWNIFFFSQIFISLILFIIGLSEILETGINTRVDATLGNPIYLSVIFLFSIFFGIYLLFENYSKFTKYFLAVTILLNCLGVFFTGTRGAMVGIFVAGLFLLIYFLISKWQLSKIRFAILSFLILIILLPTLLFSFKDSSFVQNIHTLNRVTQINITEGTGYARFVNWGIAWQGIKESPFIGWGQENYFYVFDKFYDPRMYEQEPFFDSSHNTILDVWTHGGLLALIAYLSIFAFAVYYLFKRMDLSRDQKYIFASLLLAYFIQNLFVFDNLTSFLLFFLVLAFFVSYKDRVIQKEQKILAGVFSTVSVALAFLITYFAVAIPWTANLNLLSAVRMFQRNTDGETVFFHPNGISDNQKYFEKSLEKNKTGVLQIKTAVASSIDSVNRIQTENQKIKQSIENIVSFSINGLKQEVERNPQNSKIKYTLGFTLLKNNMPEEAEKYLEEAVFMSPNRQLYLYVLGNTKKVLKKDQEYLEITEKIYRLNEDVKKSLLDYFVALNSVDQKRLDDLILELKQKNKEKQFIEVLDELISRKPEELNVHINKIVLLAKLNLFEESIKEIEKVSELFPEVENQLNVWKVKLQKGELPE